MRLKEEDPLYIYRRLSEETRNLNALQEIYKGLSDPKFHSGSVTFKLREMNHFPREREIEVQNIDPRFTEILVARAIEESKNRVSSLAKQIKIN